MDNSWERWKGRLAAALACLCGAQLAVWLPFYLTWPWYADHDVFATMARGWDAGQLPYRDQVSNNFPGTVYLFWVLGKVFDWGCVPAFYAADAVLLVALGAVLWLWSHARFGGALPGVVGYLMALSYYLALDFSQAAQRDWHAPALAAIGLLAAQTWPGRAGAALSVLGVSAGFLVRPQVVLLIPAALLAVTERAGSSWGRRAKVSAAWLAAVGLVTAVGFLPLVRAGVFDDFVAGLRTLSAGGDYNKNSVGRAMSLLLDEVCQFRIVSIAVGVACLAWSEAGRGLRPVARVWLTALAGVLLYAPLSPARHPYLDHPLWLIWSVNVAVLTGLILASGVPAKWQLFALLLVLGTGATARPQFCRPGPLRDAIAALREGREPVAAPAGYRRPLHNPPPWADYRALLAYLRAHTDPSTRVACLLEGVAVTGPTGRLSALPAESATWLYMVKPGDEPRFVQSLERADDSVVVWDPARSRAGTGPDTPPLFPDLDAAVRRLYRPDARFGAIEVWRRK